MLKDQTTQPTLFQEDSHANHSQLQENEEDKTMIVTSGMKLLELLPKQNQNGLLAKMLRGLLTSTTAWYSDRCKLIWKKKVSKSNVLLYQLQASVLGIKEKEFGLLPTPTQDSASERTKKYKQGGTSLATAGKLPTPTARDYKDCGANTNYEKARQKKRLPGFVEGRLSPEWVESLMGLPVGWTKLQNDRCDSRGWKEEASWLDGSWEKDIPRVAESQEHCTDRLILLGNGVVPSTAAKAWTVLDKRFKGD